MLIHTSLSLMRKINIIHKVKYNHLRLNVRQIQTDQIKPDKEVNNALDPNKKESLPQIVYRWGMPVPEAIFKKNIPTEYHGLEPSQIDDSTEWIPMFQLPRLRILRLIVTLKMSVTVMSCYICSFRLYEFLSNPSLDLFGSFALFGTTLTGLILIGNFSRQLIVQAYVTDDNRFIRLTRLTFFARRQDMVLPVNHVVPMTENNEKKSKFILKLETIPPEDTIQGYDRPEFYDEKFKICLRYGGILDGLRFERALGKILTPRVGT